MKKIIGIIGLLLGIGEVMGQISYSAANSTYTQNFDNLYGSVPANNTTQAASTLPTGWIFAEAGANANTTLRNDNGSSGTGDTYLNGATSSNERALGSFASGSLTSQWGAFFTNNTGITLTQFTLSYTGEQWKDGGSSTSVLNTQTFSYCIGCSSLTSGSYTNNTSLDFTALVNNTSADVTTDGNNATYQRSVSATVTGLSWANGTTIYIRWTDVNDAGNDDNLAIDGVSFTASTSGATIPSVTTPTATSITTTSATLGANITSDGGATITSRGTVWGTSVSPTGNYLAESGTATGVFTHSRTGLTENTVYFYRGRTTNSQGNGFSPDGSFTTLPLPPTVATGTAATATGFTANWSHPTMGSATYTYSVEADDDIAFGSINTTYNTIASSNTSQVVTGLSSGTTYYFRIKSVNATGNSVYSSVSAGITTLSPAPEINLQGNSVSIADGDVSPSTTDHTDFSTVAWGSTFTRTFTIQNTGNAVLNISGSTPFVTITGTNAADFSITTAPANTVVASGSTTFIVTFTPSGIGARTATLSILSNDSDEATYDFSIQGAGTPSNGSDIINTSFTYTNNIDYTSYQAATITNTSHSLGVYQLNIRDGAGASDADNLPTILNGVTFSSVAGIANIRSAALFDGNTLVNNAPVINTGAGTIAFSSLSYSCSDNSSRSITLRISFLTTVTDNQQISFTVTNSNVTAAGSNTSSLFNSFSSISSSTSGDNNRIEVAADRIRFSTQPTDGAVGVNLSTFSVRAQDANVNTDFDAANGFTLTTSGVNMVSGSPYTLSSGVSIISDVQFSSSQSNITLTATTTGLSTDNDDISSSFSISSVPTNSYRTIGAGVWNNNNASPAIWEKFNGSSWMSSNSPSYSTSDMVYIRHAISTAGSFGTTVQFTIENGGNLSVGHNGTAAYALVNSGGILTVTDGGFTLTASVSKNLILESGGKLVLNAPTLDNADNFWNGNEDFKSGSTVELKDWNYSGGSGIQRLVANPSQISVNSNGNNYLFGNVTLDCLPTSFFGFIDGSQTIKLCENDLRITNNSGSQGIGFTNALASVEVGGSLYVLANTFRFAASNSTGTITSIIKGNVSVEGSAILNINSTLSNVTDNSVELHGNLSVATTATLTTSDASESNVYFVKQGIQTIDLKGTLGNNVDFKINSGSELQLTGQNLAMSNAGNDFDVKSGGILNFNNFNITGSGAFDLKSGGRIKITSSNGVNTSGATGNVQTTTRTFSQTGIYHFTGATTPQSTGTSMTSGSTAKRIVIEKTNATDEVSLTQSTGTTDSLKIIQGIFTETASASVTGTGILAMSNGTYKSAVTGTTLPQISGSYSLSGGTIELNAAGNQTLRGARDYRNLTFSNSGTKTVTSAPTSIMGTITVSDAVILDVSNSSMGSATTNLTMTGTSRYKTAGTGTKPDASGTYSLGAGTTMEFSNVALTQENIRLTPSYYNIEVSGSSVGTFSLSSGIQFQSGGTFTVKTGGAFKLINTNGFSGSTTTAVSSTNTPTITLESGSTIHYNGAAQTITNLQSYQGLTLSGSGIKTAPSSTLDIQGNFTNNTSGVTFANNGGLVTFSGSAQNLDLSLANPTYFNDLSFSGSGTKTIDDTCSISGTATLSGTAAITISQKSLTFISTASATARLAAITSSAVTPVTGSITMQRYIPARRTFKYLSSPVLNASFTQWQRNTHITGAGGAANGFDATYSNNPSCFYYLQSDTGASFRGLKSITNTAQTITLGAGYRVFVRGDRTVDITTGTPPATVTTLALTGTPNTGTVPMPVSYTITPPSGKPTQDGWNFVGNPYPSQIDWNAAGWTKTNMDNAIYIWDPLQSTNGAYFSYVNGSGSDPRTNPSIIASSQGFYVKANAASPVLTATEPVKVATTHTANFREASQENLLRIKVSKGQNWDYTLLRFGDIYQESFEGDRDALKMGNPDINLSSVIQGISYSINSLPTKYATPIPLNISAADTGQYAFNFAGLSTFQDSSEFFLVDHFLGQTIKILDSSQYAFKISSQAQTKGLGRFYLQKTIPTILGLTGQGNKKATFNIFPNPTAHAIPVISVVQTTDQFKSNKSGTNNSGTNDLEANKLEANLEGKTGETNIGIESISIMDISGKEYLRHDYSDSKTWLALPEVQALPKGIYFLKIHIQDQVYVEKLIVQN